MNKTSIEKPIYTLEDIYDIKEKLKTSKIGYCDVLSKRTYKLIHQINLKKKHFLNEDYDDIGPYYKYVITKIYNELAKYGVAFVALQNGGYGTFFHTFVLFKTSGGLVRFDSYGKSDRHFIKYGRWVAKHGYILYSCKITEWVDFEHDMEMLLTLTNLGRERLMYWNKVFSAIETKDTPDSMDVIIFSPE